MEEKREKEGERDGGMQRLVATSEELSSRKKEDDEGAYESEATQRAHVSSHVFRISSARNATDENRHGTARRGTARHGGGLSVLRFSLLHTAQRTQWFAAAMQYIISEIILKILLLSYIFFYFYLREGTFFSFFYLFYFFFFFLRKDSYRHMREMKAYLHVRTRFIF